MAFTGMMFGQSSSSVTLTSSSNPSTYGSSVTFTATITPSAATGTVTFKDGSTTLGTGAISSGTATYGTSALSVGSHSITAVYGGDSNYNGSTSSVLTQTINAVPQVTTTSLPAGKAGTSYSATLAATAGTTPYTWSISSGSLPAGLSLNASTGAITGAPTAAGTTNFTVQVTDADSITATQPLSIVITFLPSGWADTDVGTVSPAGSATFSGGTFTAAGAGGGIGGTADAMHLVYQTLVGDGSIVARVASLQGSATSPQAGVMIRETLTAGSTNAFVYFQPNYAYLQYRSTTGANTGNWYKAYQAAHYPYWVKLVRSGNTFTGYFGLDGVNWIQIGTQTISMASSVYIGLAVSGQGYVETATFDNVSINSTAVPAPVISSLSATTASVGSQVNVSGNNFGATQGGSVVLLNGTTVAINSWSNTSIVFTVPSGATSGLLVVSVAPGMNDSNPVEFEVTTQPLPTSWLNQDIGVVGTLTGSATFSGETFTVKGGGSGTGGTADAMQFVYQALNGDGSIIARVASLQGSATSPQAGVMIRETLTAGSTNAFVYFQPNYAYLQYRSTTGGSAGNWSKAYQAACPYWVNLVRTGNTFTGYISLDGVDWTQIGTQTVSMASSVYIGLAVSGDGYLETANFDNVSINSSTAPAPVITGLSATTASVGSQVEISGNNFGGTQGGSVVLLNGSPVTINQWGNAVITFTVPVGATSGLLVVSVAPSMNDSNPVQFEVTTQPLPASWWNQDVGVVGTLTGSATFSGGTFTVTGGGGGIGGTADAMQFVYQMLTGDGSIIARVTSLQKPPNPAVSVAGVMIREMLSAGSKDAFVYFQPNYANLQFRTTTGANVATNYASFVASYPYWLQLVRTGNTFTGYASLDGVNWTQTGASTTISMAQTVYIGLAVSGDGYLETATFDNVSINSTAIPAPVITGMSATTASVGSQVYISGNYFGATQGGSVVLLNGTSVTITQWNNDLIGFTVPAGATSGLLVVSVAPSMNDSNPIQFEVTTQPLPASWWNQDVGAVGTLTGSATFSGGTFTVTGGGAGTGGTADAMQFVYQTLTGDGSIIARVASLQGSATFPQAGVMIRETLTSGSKDAFVYFHPSMDYLQYRSTTGGNVGYWSAGYTSPPYPYWVKLVRSGNTFTGYIAPDGVNWTQIGAPTVSMAQVVYIGLAVSGQGYLETATFDNVSINSTAVPAPAITGMSATTASVGSQVQITGNNFGAMEVGGVVLLNGTPVPINLWSNTSIVFTVPVGATSGLLVVAVAPSMNDSNPVTLVVTSQPLPGPWLDQDVGVVGTLFGSGTYSNGTFSVSGAGGGIGNTADGMHFVYQPLAGDGSIIARVTSLQNGPNPSVAQAGVMIRETLSAGSKDAFVYFQPNYANLQFRTTTGANVATNYASFVASYPYWLQLVRTGNTFTGYASLDGVNWTQTGASTTISMAQTVYIGLAVSGDGYLEPGTFDNVMVRVGTTPFVTSVTPFVGTFGTSVTITGSNFGIPQGLSTVSFNGALATSITGWTSSQIIAVVPASTPVGTGPVTVTVNSLTSPGTAASLFTVIDPVITSLEPPAGPVGGILTINGTGFGSSQNGAVLINGVNAGVWWGPGPAWTEQWSDTQIQVFIPTTTSGLVTVSNNGIVSNGVPFTVSPPPAIINISPISGVVGTAVTINGSGFGSMQSNNSVAFGGVVAATASGWSDSQIIVNVPQGAISGAVTVTVANTTAQGPTFILDTIAVLTASNGSQTTYGSTLMGGTWNMYSSVGPGCSSCTVRGNEQDTYDINGNLLTTTDANGNTITYTYDGYNNMTSRSAQLNGQPVATSYTYNSFGEVLTMTDPLGNTTTNTYDANGNLLTITSPAPNGQTPPSVTQFTYNNLGELTQILDPLNHATTLTYTAAGLIYTITDAQNHVTTYGYDTRGNRTSVIDPINGSAHPTTFTFDIMNRLTGITYPDGTSVGFGYDYRGRRTTVTDQNSKTTTYAYDDADRLISVTDAANNLTQYNYDTENNLLSITDGNNHTTYFAYDPLGRVTQTTFPSTLVETYGYDQLYNLTSKTDRKNQTTQYVYDSLYRMTSKTYPDSTAANYVYDLVGKIQQVTDPTGTYGFAYDNMGRLIGTSTQYSFLPGHNFQNGYGYDATSNRTSLTAPDGSHQHLCV